MLRNYEGSDQKKKWKYFLFLEILGSIYICLDILICFGHFIISKQYLKELLKFLFSKFFLKNIFTSLMVRAFLIFWFYLPFLIYIYIQNVWVYHHVMLRSIGYPGQIFWFMYLYTFFDLIFFLLHCWNTIFLFFYSNGIFFCFYFF